MIDFDFVYTYTRKKKKNFICLKLSTYKFSLSFFNFYSDEY